MSGEHDNAVIARRWFEEFWGNVCNLAIVDELAANDILLQYSHTARRRGHDALKAFMQDLRNSIPDLKIWAAGDFTAKGKYVLRNWEGAGTYVGLAFTDFPPNAYPRAIGKRIRFTGTTMLHIANGRIAEETVWVTGLIAFPPLRLVQAGDRCCGTAPVHRR